MANKSKGYSLFSRAPVSARTSLARGATGRATKIGAYSSRTPRKYLGREFTKVTSRKFRSAQERDAWLKKEMVERPQKRVARKRKKSPANKAQKRAARAWGRR